MFPIRTRNPLFSAPVVTVALIVANLGVFLLMRADGETAFQRRVLEYGLVPRRVVSGAHVTYLMADAQLVAAIDRGSGAVDVFIPGLEATLGDRLRRLDAEQLDAPITMRLPQIVETPLGPRRVGPDRIVNLTPVEPRMPPWLSVPTSMFMHAGWLHLLGNLWFLWLFGAGVEDVLGRLGFLVFYLLTGVAAAAAHILDDTRSMLPCLGASGAISGVMGGFLMLFPRAEVLALGPVLLGGLIPLPAFLFLGFYLFEQIFMSVRHADSGGGVAWWAHIGGFVSGMIAVRAFPVSANWAAAFGHRRPSGRRFGYDYASGQPPDDDDDPDYPGRSERRRTHGY